MWAQDCVGSPAGSAWPEGSSGSVEREPESTLGLTQDGRWPLTAPSPSQACPRAQLKASHQRRAGLGIGDTVAGYLHRDIRLSPPEKGVGCQGDYIIENLNPGSQDTAKARYLTTTKTAIDYLYHCRLPSYTPGPTLAQFGYRPMRRSHSKECARLAFLCGPSLSLCL